MRQKWNSYVEEWKINNLHTYTLIKLSYNWEKKKIVILNGEHSFHILQMQFIWSHLLSML